MTDCVRGSTVKTTDLDYYDVRYFYFDREGKLGRYTCGIAREVMATLLREFRSAHFLSATWPANELLRNPIVLGFVIEQQCLNSMMTNGLKVGTFNFGPNSLDTISATGTVPQVDLEKKLALYIPMAFNKEAIDGAIVSIFDGSKKPVKRAVIIPIQITISDSRSDSELAFFSRWEQWKNQFKVRKIKVSVHFLWITEKKSVGMKEIGAKRAAEYKGRIFDHPTYHRTFVKVSEVNKDVGSFLQGAREVIARYRSGWSVVSALDDVCCAEMRQPF
jgi:hypothetical protein